MKRFATIVAVTVVTILGALIILSDGRADDLTQGEMFWTQRTSTDAVIIARQADKLAEMRAQIEKLTKEVGECKAP